MPHTVSSLFPDGNKAEHYRTSGTSPMQRCLHKPFRKAYVAGHLSLFNNRDPMLTALRAFIIPAVILTHFQPCRNKNQFTADKLFTDLIQSRTADRTVFLFLRKIQIFFSTGIPLKRSASVALALRFFGVFQKKMLPVLPPAPMQDPVPVLLH